ncbi:MAG: putative ABC transporter permease subunit [Erysipelotrichaceae bacterium]|jgi:ABC-2 type transport system permease protein
MIKRVLSLSKVLIKTNIVDAFSKQQGVSKRKLSTIILLILAYGYFCAIAGFFSYNIINTLMEVNQQTAFISMICLINAVGKLVGTIFTSASILYFSKDNEYLLPLPFQPFEIVAGKLNTLLVYSYFSEIFLGLIPLSVYGYLTKAPVLFYVFSIAVLLILPVVPVLLSALVMMVVMSFVNLSKHKGLFQVLSVIFVLVISMFISIYSSGDDVTQQQMILILTQADGLAKSLYSYFPTLKFASEALINVSFVSLLLLAVVSAAAYLVTILAGNRLYFKGVVGNSTTGSYSKKKVGKKDFVKGSVALNYVLKEFRCLIRKPVYFTQCFLLSLLLPAIMAVSFSQGIGGFDELVNLGLMINQNDKTGHIVFSVLLMIFLFTSMYTYISITAVSRDGSSAVFMKYIPVPFYQQLIYKCIPDILLSFFPSGLLFVLVAVFMKLSVLPVALSVIVFAVFTVGRSFFGIIIDCRNPKHNFTSEYQVVKSNAAIFYDIAYNFVLMIPSILSLIFLSKLPLLAVFIINLLVHGGLSYGLYKYIETKDFELAKKIY